MASTSQEKGNDLEEAKQAFETTVRHPDLEAVVTVRRRRRAKAFQCEDLLFVVEFKQSATAGNLRLLSVLMTVYSSILELVRKLKVYFDDKKRDTVSLDAQWMV